MLPAMVGRVLDRKTWGVTIIVGPLNLEGSLDWIADRVGEETEPPE